MYLDHEKKGIKKTYLSAVIDINMGTCPVHSFQLHAMYVIQKTFRCAYIIMNEGAKRGKKVHRVQVQHIPNIQ